MNNEILMHYPSSFISSDYDCIIVVDIGFAAEEKKNCGLVIANRTDSEGHLLEAFQTNFTDIIFKVFTQLKKYGGKQNSFALIIEAPLSVHFENDSPKQRIFNKNGMPPYDEKNYSWYAPVGASVMAGAVILLKSLFMKDFEREQTFINLFEAFSVRKKSNISEDTANKFINNLIKTQALVRNEALDVMKSQETINDWVDAVYIAEELIRNGNNLWHVSESDKNPKGFVKSICAFFRLDEIKTSIGIPSIVLLDHKESKGNIVTTK